jgi:2-amino-4-hydroxy-6-hydroxymethyldihydropteridine diphosphokinase
MTTAVLSIGSNMGDSLGFLRDAVRGLGDAVRRVSSVYRTPPWGPVAQDDFLNIAVVVSDGAVDATGWLERCHELERAAHRERLVRWGPRTLDADVVAVWRQDAGAVSNGADRVDLDTSARPGYDAPFGSDTTPVLSADPVLTLPHPRAHERAFVLVPWHEIQPSAVLPGHGPVATLLAGLDVSDIVCIGELGVGPRGVGDRGGQQV